MAGIYRGKGTLVVLLMEAVVEVKLPFSRVYAHCTEHTYKGV